MSEIDEIYVVIEFGSAALKYLNLRLCEKTFEPCTADSMRATVARDVVQASIGNAIAMIDAALADARAVAPHLIT